MKKTLNLFLILPILFGTGCSSQDPLFFTGDKASDEEVLEFFSKINEGKYFHKEGRYFYENKQTEDGKLYLYYTYKLYLIPYYDEDIDSYNYKCTKMYGECANLANESSLKMKKDDGIYYRGSNLITFSIEHLLLQANNLEVFIKNSSIHFSQYFDYNKNKRINVSETHSAYKFDDNFDKSIIAKSEFMFTDNEKKGHSVEIFEPCEDPF